MSVSIALGLQRDLLADQQVLGLVERRLLRRRSRSDGGWQQTNRDDAGAVDVRFARLVEAAANGIHLHISHQARAACA